MIDDIIRSSVFYGLSMIENQDFVTEGLHQCKIVADQDKWQIFFLFQFGQQFQNLFLHGYIQCAGCLITDQDVRTDCKRSGNCCSLTLSSTDLMWIAACVFRIQTTSFEKIFHTFPCFCTAYPHVPKTFPNSVSQSTSRIKRFHRHLKNHLDILIGFS